MRYHLFGISDIGDFRENNEDYFLIDNTVKTNGSFECVSKAPFLTAVCDGVSGKSFGEIAADMTLTELARISYDSSIDLFREILKIDKKLKRYSRKNPDAFDMQTTLCCLAADEQDRLLFANIGDSRIYLYSDGFVEQLSNDHSPIWLLHTAGRIQRDEIANHELSGKIFPVLGNSKFSVNPELFSMNHISKNDIILLCSDGFSDFLTDEEIEIGLSLELPLSQRIKTLVELALERGSTDNITAVAISSLSD